MPSWWRAAVRRHLRRVGTEERRVRPEVIDPQQDREPGAERADDDAHGADRVRRLTAAAEHPGHVGMICPGGCGLISLSDPAFAVGPRSPRCRKALCRNIPRSGGRPPPAGPARERPEPVGDGVAGPRLGRRRPRRRRGWGRRPAVSSVVARRAAEQLGHEGGGVQLTPTATTCGLAATIETASSNGVPSLRWAPSRQEKLTHAGTSASASSTSTSASASTTDGIVSIASRSGPAARKASARGRWKSRSARRAACGAPSP